MKFIIRHIDRSKFVFVLLCLSLGSCTEQYIFQNSATFESIPVVQANITNELKKQEIKITRTYRLEENGPTFEKGAIVYVTDSENNTYEFEAEDFSGLYISKKPFQAVLGRTYQLNITTQDGKSYSSSSETLTPINEIQVEPKIETIDGEKGVQIVVTSYDPNGKSQFYRFEYDETYKIVSPDWKPNKLILDPSNPGPDFTYLSVPRDNSESRICFTTNKSDDLMLISNVGLNEDRINLPIRFIDIKSPMLYEKYSIIVREYVQNLASYTYYSTLKKLSSSESLFSQVQPGFNYGNLKSNDNSDEKIVGYFEISSVSSKRIFFKFRDIFIDDPYPPFIADCSQTIELSNCFTTKFCRGPQIYLIVTGSGTEYVYYATLNKGASYVFTPAPCGDCTKISSNIKPLFWID
ncbi:DUF4249 domain-containing protein [Flavobacterium sp. ANB]|uniref:DUF4249 domain-containing protein n=1 Tax=unclassified Flavobacterium TaxID=196869 RepID=UPI0012B9FFCE|nr:MULTISPECIES: DUF4249 domain-containing protein [unclassified Flavobacterium]MBF4514912.1 DUF4249 domain-containing protein [Flavobacterium sp. ANB]MTD68238.1 DUF4249 family protein [Flavobacterium sp. LC2016-13]